MRACANKIANGLVIAVICALGLAALLFCLYIALGLSAIIFVVAAHVFPAPIAALITLAVVGWAGWRLATSSPWDAKRCPHCREKKLECYFFPSMRHSPWDARAYYRCANCAKRYACRVRDNWPQWKEASSTEYDHFYRHGTVAFELERARLKREREKQESLERAALKPK